MDAPGCEAYGLSVARRRATVGVLPRGLLCFFSQRLTVNLELVRTGGIRLSN